MPGAFHTVLSQGKKVSMKELGFIAKIKVIVFLFLFTKANGITVNELEISIIL